MCKRRTACSSTEAHQMTLIPSPQGMSHIEKYVKKDSVMLQQFIQHDGVIVKVYVADGQISASTRPSFKNLDRNGGTKKKKIDSFVDHEKEIIHSLYICRCRPF